MKLLIENWKKYLTEVYEPPGELQIVPRHDVGRLTYTDKGGNTLEISHAPGEGTEDLMISFNGKAVRGLDLVDDATAASAKTSRLQMILDLEKALTELTFGSRKALIRSWLKPFLETNREIPAEVRSALEGLWIHVREGGEYLDQPEAEEEALATTSEVPGEESTEEA